MIKHRFSLGLLALFATMLAQVAPLPAVAQGISQKVAVCNPDFTGRCIKPDTNGAVPVTGSLTPSGTQDTNTKQVNGATVNVGAGAAGTGTQRVITSTDSTIGTVTTVGAVTAITNALPTGANVIGHVIADTGSTTAATQATASNLNAQVVGNAAGGAADSGNSLKVGCKYNVAIPTYVDGNRTDCQTDTRGNIHINIFDTNGNTGVSVVTPSSASGMAGSLRATNANLLFNGATWDMAFTCPTTATVNVTAGSTTQIVGLSGSTIIRVCSLALSMSAAGSAGVYTGTGTNCGTGTTALIQDMTLPTGTPLAFSAPEGGSIVRSSSGGELCVKAVTGNVTGVITYAQF